MKKGVVASSSLLVLLLTLLAPAALAFNIAVTPGSISTTVQAGGYVSQPIDVHADVPVDVLAAASDNLRPLLRLTRHNQTSVLVHILPPQSQAQGVIEGTLLLTVQGSQPFVSASLQRAEIPLNVSINIQGVAERPALIALPPQQIEIVPLSFDTATLLVVVIGGVVVLNVVLRAKQPKKYK